MAQKEALAIIIPFYKIFHFETLLEGLLNQTNKNFTVYVCNDCSPHDPEPILEKYYGRLKITYRRFSDRLGHASLSKQWNRCLELTKGEEWVWFLPDDDLPSPNCVEEFYKALEGGEKNNIKVFRLPLEVIDNLGHVLREVRDNSPAIETNYEFYSRVVAGKATSTLGDNIFKKKELVASGGFVNFPMAWGADHATVIKVSSGGNLGFLRDAKFGFRMSGENISSDILNGLEKISARILFAHWMKENEDIFSQKPDAAFYKSFFRKSEYYLVYEWPFNFKIWKKLYQLSVICNQSYNPLPVAKLLIMKCLKAFSRKTDLNKLLCIS